MKATPFVPLAGERLLAVQPQVALRVDAGWRRRIRHFPGRSLTATSLRLEQEERLGRLALRGQLTSHGIVNGLSAGIRTETTEAGSVSFLEITPGLGVCASGEGVVLPRAVEYPLPALLPEGFAPAEGEQNAFVLLLQPVEVSIMPGEPRLSPCDDDASEDAFLDWQLIDACRVQLMRLPEDLPIPGASPDWRNLLAYSVFSREAGFSPRDTFPWEERGVALGLLGMTGAVPEFLDRAAVARDGGRPRSRTPLLRGSGDARLWRARLVQLAEQVADIESTGGRLADQSAQFRFLPPAGLLPADAITLAFNPLNGGAVVTQNFFRPAQVRQVTPIPVEQLDLVLAASSPLAVVDRNIDSVDLLVPIPGQFFEPDLLRAERADSRFETARNSAVQRRGEALLRRLNVRRQANQVQQTLTAKDATFDDSGVLDPSEQAVDALPDGATAEVDYIARANSGLDAISARYGAAQLLVLAQLYADPAAEFKRLQTMGLTAALADLEKRAQLADDRIDLGFLRVQSDMYRVRQIVLGSTAASRLTTSPVAASIVEGRSAVATEKLLADAITSLRASPADAQVRFTEFDVLTNAVIRNGEPIIQTGIAAMTTASDFQTSATSSALNIASKAVRIGRGAEVKPAVSFLKPVSKGATVIEKIIDFGNEFTTPPKEVVPPKPIEVTGKSPVVGKVDLRTSTVAERLSDPPATEAWFFAIASKKAVLESLLDEAFAHMFDTLVVPRVFESEDTPENGPTIIRRRNIALKDIKIADNILSERVSSRVTDESGFFSAAVDVLERVIAVLRLAEGRVAMLRQAIAICKEALAEVTALATEINNRLTAIAQALNEARHDVAVTSALLDEERLRVNSVNERRTQILATQVGFIAYHRPRTTAAIRDMPVVPVQGDLLEAPVPACLTQSLTPPDELAQYLEVLKEAPIGWFPRLEQLAGKLDTPDRFRDTMLRAKDRALSKTAQMEAAIANVKVGAGNFTAGIQSTLVKQQRTALNVRRAFSALDPRVFENIPWSDFRKQAPEVLTIGDLLSVEGRSDIAAQAVREWNDLGRLGACLFTAFTEVPATLRLDWALRLSQFDQAFLLRNLAVLPGFGEIDYVDRQAMQGLVDYLFDRAESKLPEAVTAINDLVRICLLLASHAPVAQIISGAVAEPVDVSPGTLVQVNVDLSRVRLGMQVSIFGAGVVQARGTIDDMDSLVATIRVDELTDRGQPAVRIEKGARVTVFDAKAVDRSPAVQSLARAGQSKTQFLMEQVRVR